MLKKILVLSLFSVFLVPFSVSPSQAAVAIKASSCAGAFYTCDKWFTELNEGDENADFNHTKYTYDKYFPNCLTDPGPSEKSVKVIALVPDASNNIISNNIQTIRAGLRRATSVFAASTRRTYDDPSTGADEGFPLEEDYSPRWETFTGGAGRCNVKVHFEEMTQTEINQYPIPNTYNELRSRGYNNINTKYVVLHNSNCFTPNPPTGSCTGVSDRKDDTNTDPALNDNNQGDMFSSIYVGKDSLSLEGFIGKIVVHELSHSLGAVQENAPNFDTANGHIAASDSNDILSYSQTGASCIQEYTELRFDCKADDYFNINNSIVTWNIADSYFLW